MTWWMPMQVPATTKVTTGPMKMTVSWWRKKTIQLTKKCESCGFEWRKIDRQLVAVCEYVWCGGLRKGQEKWGRTRLTDGTILYLFSWLVFLLLSLCIISNLELNTTDSVQGAVARSRKQGSFEQQTDKETKMRAAIATNNSSINSDDWPWVAWRIEEDVCIVHNSHSYYGYQ